MNEKLQYAEMLEIPVNTCNITYKPPKKRKFKIGKKVNAEEVKAELIDKINSSEQPECVETDEAVENGVALSVADSAENVLPTERDNGSLTVEIRQAEKSEKKKRGKLGVIAVQLAVIGVLLATIFITNALFADSGINTFFKGVFGRDAETADERNYSDFVPVIKVNGGALSTDNGVLTMSCVGSMYAPCDGTVTALSVGNDGKYTVEISHSDNFKTVISGLDFVYSEQNGNVFANIPVGYVSDTVATMCFYDGETLITDFTLTDNTVVWAV